MFKNKRHISLALSTILVGSMALTGCGGGGGGDSTSTTPAPVARTVSGVVIDGAVSGASVLLKGLSTSTDSLGAWSLSYTGDDSDVASAKGGIDTATGEAFEGTLKGELGATAEEVVISPISTLVSALVTNGSTKDAARSKVATQIGVSVDTIKANPIALLASGSATQKAEAAKALKSALIVQKAVESLAKSLGDTESSEFETTFESAYKVVALKLDTQAESAEAFNTVMSDTASIVTSLSSELAGKVSDALVSQKLQAAQESVAKVVQVVKQIKESDLSSASDTNAAVVKISKAVEIVTRVLEKEVAKIASATNTAAIAEAKNAATTAIKAVTMSGGVAGTETRIASRSATLSAASFAQSVFSDDTLTTLGSAYDEYIASGLSQSIILEVGARTATTSSASAIADAINAVLQEAVAAGEMSSEEAAVVNVVGLVDTTATTNTHINDKVNDAVTEEPTTPTTPEEPAVGGGGSGGSGDTTVTNSATASVPAASFDNLAATATVSDAAITVDGITDATLSNNIFSLARQKITLTTTGTPTLTQKFDAIKSGLSGMLDITLRATDGTTNLNKNVMVTILIKGQGTDYVAAATNATFLKSGNLSVTVPASGNILRMGTSIDGTTLTATKANAGANSVTSATVGGEQEIKISATSIIDDFANNALIGNTIKQYMVDYTTKAGAYDVYLLINNTNGSASFVGNNSVSIDATALNTLVSGSGVVYTLTEKAVHVRLTITN